MPASSNRLCVGAAGMRLELSIASVDTVDIVGAQPSMSSGVHMGEL